MEFALHRFSFIQLNTIMENKLEGCREQEGMFLYKIGNLHGATPVGRNKRTGDLFQLFITGGG